MNESPRHTGSGNEGPGTLPVLVFSNADYTLGLMVDAILDIVEEAVTMRRSGLAGTGLLGSAVVGGKVVDLLDLQAVLEATGEKRLPPLKHRAPTVLLTEASPFRRGLLKCQLEMSGYHVIEAADAAEALQRFERELVQLVIVDGALLEDDRAGLEQLRKRTLAAGISLLSVSDTPDQRLALQASNCGLDEYLLRSERTAMLASVARLAQALAPRSASLDQTIYPTEEKGELLHA